MENFGAFTEVFNGCLESSMNSFQMCVLLSTQKDHKISFKNASKVIFETKNLLSAFSGWQMVEMVIDLNFHYLSL